MRAPVDITGLRCRLTLKVKECLPSIRLLTQLEQEWLEVRCQRIGRRQRLDSEPVALQKARQFRRAKHMTLMRRRRIIFRSQITGLDNVCHTPQRKVSECSQMPV